MYMACRHIKPNGLRCKSPALRGGRFCYFHSKLHNTANDNAAKFETIRLPVLEDPAAIQISISRIFDAMINNRIDGKLAGRLLYGLQIESVADAELGGKLIRLPGIGSSIPPNPCRYRGIGVWHAARR